jgi:hypothetical protein
MMGTNMLNITGLHPTCTLKNRSCIRRCTCPSPLFSSPSSSHKNKSTNNSSLSALDVLVRLYIHQHSPATAMLPIPIKKEPSSSPSPQEPRRPGTGTGTGTGRERDTIDASFLRGHLAVLFGLLMRGNAVNQVYILNALGDVRVSVSRGERAKEGLRSGLERLIEQAREFAAFYALLSASGRGGQDGEAEAQEMKESKVARDIVLFLENLRGEVKV